MTKRIAIASVSERDIDLLLLEEFQSSRAFQQWFVCQILGKGACLRELISAKRSVIQSTGESDLEVAFADASGGEVRFLIENKVSAGFQPQQAERYRKRADSCAGGRDGSSYYTVIVAPSRYFGDAQSSKGFDKRISYEAVVDWFAQAAELGERRMYKIALLQSAIDKGTLGYQPIEDAPVTAFWHAYRLMARDHAPELEMKEPSLKPSRSGFIYFRPPSLPHGIEICHKFNKGYVDLQVKGMGKRLNELDRALRRHLQPDMKLTSAGKSAAIRVIVPVLEPSRPLSDQMSQARTGLQAAQGLLHWFLEKRQFMPNRVLQPTPKSRRD